MVKTSRKVKRSETIVKQPETTKKKQVIKLEGKNTREIKSDRKSDRKIIDDVKTEGKKLLNVKNLLKLEDKKKISEERLENDNTTKVKKIVDRLENLGNVTKKEERKFKFENLEEKRKCKQEDTTQNQKKNTSTLDRLEVKTPVKKLKRDISNQKLSSPLKLIKLGKENKK